MHTHKTPSYAKGSKTIEVPFKFAICSCCDGHGKSSAYLGAYTADEMDQAGPEFREEYMRGDFDRKCETCDGTGKVKVPNYAEMTPEMAKEFRKWEKEEDAYNDLVAGEARVFGYC